MKEKWKSTPLPHEEAINEINVTYYSNDAPISNRIHGTIMRNLEIRSLG